MEIAKQNEEHNEDSLSKRERTRRHIIAEAKQVFASKGYASANVVDIVSRLDVAHGTFYYHFPDKKAVLIEMLGEFLDKVKAMTASWAETTDTAPEAAERFVRGVAQLLYDNRDLARIALREDYRDEPDIRDLITETTSFLHEQTARALDLGMALGSVRPMDTQLAAVATIGMVKEVVFDLIERGDDTDIDHIVRELSALQNFGIRPRITNNIK